MRHLIIFLVIFLACPFADADTSQNIQSEIEIKKEYYPNGNLKSEMPYKDGRKHGVIKQYYENGKLFLESYVEDGLLEGEAKTYDENGNLISEGIYSGGEARKSRMYYINGKVKMEQNFKDGKVDGAPRIFNEKGEPATIEEITKILTQDARNSIIKSGGDLEEFDGKIQENKRKANDAMAKGILRILSTASETYATMARGKYPTNIKELMSASPPPISQNYCESASEGFNYDCELSLNGYVFKAIPVEIGISGTTTYTIKTGGILSPKKSKEEIAKSLNKQAEGRLNVMSMVAEDYARKHEGQYPTDMSGLNGGEWCDNMWGGFVISCENNTEGYKFTATPAEGLWAVSGTTTHSITTGGNLSP